MTQEPFSRLEQEVNAVVANALAGGGSLAVAYPDCICHHSHEHHDGFGCAEVHKGRRCSCETYRAGLAEGA